MFVANVTVIDVATGKAAPKQTVAIKVERVTAVLPVNETVAPTGAKVVDGTGKFLIPGLQDIRAHVALQAYDGWFLCYGSGSRVPDRFAKASSLKFALPTD